MGHCPPQPVSVLGPAPTLSPSFLLAQAIFEPNLFPYKFPNISQPQSFFTPTCLWRWNRQSAPKRQHIKFRRQGITQKKAYNIQNTPKVSNQEEFCYIFYVHFILLMCMKRFALQSHMSHSEHMISVDTTSITSIKPKLLSFSEELNIINRSVPRRSKWAQCMC
jgi:hypothetical protein